MKIVQTVINRRKAVLKLPAPVPVKWAIPYHNDCRRGCGYNPAEDRQPAAGGDVMFSTAIQKTKTARDVAIQRRLN